MDSLMFEMMDQLVKSSAAASYKLWKVAERLDCY